MFCNGYFFTIKYNQCFKWIFLQLNTINVLSWIFLQLNTINVLNGFFLQLNTINVLNGFFFTIKYNQCFKWILFDNQIQSTQLIYKCPETPQ